MHTHSAYYYNTATYRVFRYHNHSATPIEAEIVVIVRKIDYYSTILSIYTILYR
jgi:hypothetical protein